MSGAGIALMVAAVTCFAGLDATAKWVGQGVPPVQVVGLRYASAFVFIVLVCRPWERLRSVRSRNLPVQVWRGLTLVGATVCSFTSLHYLPLGQVTAIQFVAPLVIVVLSGPVLGEWPGRHRAGAVVVGFIGVVLVTRPAGAVHWAVGVAGLTAVANAAYALLTRRLAGRDRPQTTLFWSGLVGAVATAPVMVGVWAPVPWAVWGAVVGMGVLAALGHYLLILANERAGASVLAPFTYAQLVSAVGLGWVVFGDAPDVWVVVGGAVVAGSGLYVLYRERVRRGVG